jgi:MFS family permease
MSRWSPAFTFVFTMGIVNLFGDVTYEGGASINGPFMATLGASAAAVSIAAGGAECLGYALRPFAGYIADKGGRYWLITFVGYVINLVAMPLMALAGNWQIAAILIVAERVGRAIRKPTVDAMLSYTTGELGRGWVYALNTALDETGATIGPLIIAAVLWLRGDFRQGYALLSISAVLAICSLAIARINFPVPSKLERGQTASAKALGPTYWIYMLAGACFAAGLMSFELISYHLSKTGVVTGYWTPLFLAISTSFGVIASLALGKLFDRFGLSVVLMAVLATSVFSPLVFFGAFPLALVGIMLWGLGYATQDTLLKALVATVLPERQRNFAFGLFYAGYGVGWLVGSVVTGLLYEHSLSAMVVFAVAAQLAALPIFAIAPRFQN